VAAQHEGCDVGDGYLQLLGQEAPIAGAIQHAGHTDHALAREAANPVRELRHGIQRVGNQNQDRVRRLRHHVLDHLAHDVHVGLDEVRPAHTGLASNPRGYDRNVRARGLRVAVGPTTFES